MNIIDIWLISSSGARQAITSQYPLDQLSIWDWPELKQVPKCVGQKYGQMQFVIYIGIPFGFLL